MINAMRAISLYKKRRKKGLRALNVEKDKYEKEKKHFYLKTVITCEAMGLQTKFE